MDTITGRANKYILLTIDAYGVAVKNGFKGTVQEWLASLKGESPTEEDLERAVAAYLEDHPVSGGNGDQSAVLFTEQTLTEEQQAQARKNIGASSGLISILDADPTDPKEGQMWILKTTFEELTTPVIELGDVGEDSISIKLSNASFDGRGNAVTNYNIYLNGVLNKTEDIAPGGTCVITDLSADTEYKISVCGVSDSVLSEMSNVISATTIEPVPEVNYVYTVGEGDTVAIPGYQGTVDKGVHYLKLATYGAERAVMMSTSGDKAFTNQEGVTGTYYPIAVPADATQAVVTCPSGITASFNGYTVTNGDYTRTVDSGFKASGTVVSLEAGKCQYCYVFFSKNSNMTVEELNGVVLTFA